MILNKKKIVIDDSHGFMIPCVIEVKNSAADSKTDREEVRHLREQVVNKLYR